MTTEGFQRKLTAILSADVVGYSRLMRENEASTVRNLEENKKLISKLVKEYEGRVVDDPGDNILAEFSSVVKAVDCAVKIQKELRIKNAELIENRRMEFRIGINLGDVIEEDGRIYGDGINIAARLEALAEPGGICISRTAYDQVKTKLDLGYEYLGEHSVKNIDEPVRVYRVLTGFETAGKVIGEKRFQERKISRRLVMGTFITLIIIAAGLFSWIIYSHQSRKVKPVSTETAQVPVVSEAVKAKKAIAVLPFENLSSDPEQVYFVDGLSEEILNSLAQIPDLTVIARTSSFSFKGTNKTIQEIANVLGVDNILEGSVRKAGNAMRITAQLVKAVDGTNLWSKTYDRELKDIFEVQEDIAKAIANELKITLGVGRFFRLPGGTENTEAYALYLVTRGLFNAGETERALKSINAVIDLDPKFALAWSYKADIHSYRSIFGPSISAGVEKDMALKAALRAVELEPNLVFVYTSLGWIKTIRGDFIEARLDFNKAFVIAPEQLTGYEIIYQAIHYQAVGNFKMANELLEKAQQNDPIHQNGRATNMLNFALLGDKTRAEEEYQRGKVLFGDQWFLGNQYITFIRIGFINVLSRDEIILSDPICDTVKDYLESPQKGLAELCRLYTESNNLSSAEFLYISMWAAYFGDPEFAMDAMEKGIKIEASGIFLAWFPVMHEVRQTPRFKKFFKKLGLVDYWNKFGWPDLCRPVGDGDFVCD